MDESTTFLYFFDNLTQGKTSMSVASSRPRAARETIPEFSLYGELTGTDSADFVHIEWIETRSRLYDWHIDTHRHLGLFQVLAIFEGTVEANVDDATWEVEGPAVITVHPSAVHNFRFSRGAHGFVLTMAQSVPFDAALGVDADMESLLSKPWLFALGDAPQTRDRLYTLLGLIMDEFSRPQLGHAEMVGWLTRSVLLLLARLHAHHDSASRAGRTELDLFARFRALVETHYTEAWSIPAYAERLHVTESKLNRLCRRIAGKSAFDLVQDRLMLEARRKLIYIPAPVSHVAYELGFQDPAYFCRVFKRHVGVTPSAFRRTAQHTHLGDDA
ncbi:Arabinose operon regulatory protein [Pandoraea pulmonicola]|uniref:Arabinose operon regulatory protein n=2 Tax=Pandoraea pulmonicola TaxID=93221 RepID=A0AAJ4ZAQ4_PANPU|nr:Arabinose operon regulatory protein [Pandoraea pulmonicola]